MEKQNVLNFPGRAYILCGLPLYEQGEPPYKESEGRNTGLFT